MTANDRETAEEGVTSGPPVRPQGDPVGEFAAWLTALRRSKGNPSLDSIAREVRRRDPSATVVPSTISEILNGRRLPRWTTVEPIAHVLGGERAVAECLRRWQAADTLRRTAAAGPGVPPGRPSSPPGTETEQDTETERDLPPRGRRRAGVALAGLGCAAAATAALVVYHPAHDRSGASTATTGPGTRTSTPAPATSGPQPSPSSPVASGASAFTPGTTMLTAHTARVTRTPDGLVTVSVQSVNGNNIAGAGYSVITPWTSCSVTGADVGQSVVVPGPSGQWIRLVILDFPESTANDATKSDFDIPVDFQITRGRGTPPHADKQCT